uniref:Uncharacterized protein n=1 Tax=Neisseria meningitidis alpha153 TaxID=663926 RepID=C6SA57_NEIME|nr:hypothetical protein predicted by Glimmer/Critica [Neisseria meningitidis alpha153]
MRVKRNGSVNVGNGQYQMVECANLHFPLSFSGGGSAV